MVKRCLTIVSALVAFFAISAPAQTCTVKSITVPGAAGTSALGLNKYDTVVGIYLDNATFQLRAFRWSNGSSAKFLLSGAKNTQFNDINDSGVIVGSYESTDNHNHGLRRSGAQNTTIDYPGAFNTILAAINNSGTMVGWFTKTASGPATSFRKTSLGWTLLRFPNATNTWALGISDTGEIVGRYQDASGLSHGFTYSSGTFTNVDFPGADATAVRGANKYGSLVGFYTTAKDEPSQAWQRKGGTFSTFHWNGASSLSLNGINNLGDEVGSAVLPTTEPGFLRVCR